MDSFSIPWPCLDSSEKQPVVEKAQAIPQKSFVRALTNVCDISTSQLPQACVKGDRLAITIPEVDYLGGLESCKHNLHGRIFWPKGATPLTVADVKSKLAPIWKDLSKWGVQSLGKGFYEFVFSSLEDVKRVRSVSSWNLSPGTLRLFAWSKDFNPRVQQNQSAQVWVRFFGLSQEYWRPNILFAIASSLGTPICIDAMTAKPLVERTFGLFARVLVDMDLSQTLRDKVLVERKGFAFFVDIEYENIPEFCNHCKMIGHCITNCNRIAQVDNSLKEKEKEKKKVDKEPKKKFVQTKDGRVEQKKKTEVIIVEDSNDKVDERIEPEPSNKRSEDLSESKEREVGDVQVTKINNNTVDAEVCKSLPQQNRFAAIDTVEDADDNLEESNQENQNQSTDTAFVADTQILNDETEELNL